MGIYYLLKRGFLFCYFWGLWFVELCLFLDQFSVHRQSLYCLPQFLYCLLQRRGIYLRVNHLFITVFNIMHPLLYLDLEHLDIFILSYQLLLQLYDLLLLLFYVMSCLSNSFLQSYYISWRIVDSIGLIRILIILCEDSHLVLFRYIKPFPFLINLTHWLVSSTWLKNFLVFSFEPLNVHLTNIIKILSCVSKPLKISQKSLHPHTHLSQASYLLRLPSLSINYHPLYLLFVQLTWI